MVRQPFHDLQARPQGVRVELDHQHGYTARVTGLPRPFDQP